MWYVVMKFPQNTISVNHEGKHLASLCVSLHIVLLQLNFVAHAISTRSVLLGEFILLA